jgi:hypothetical protein
MTMLMSDLARVVEKWLMTSLDDTTFPNTRGSGSCRNNFASKPNGELSSKGNGGAVRRFIYFLFEK